MKKIPKFKNEDQERDFWATHDLTDYVDLSKGKRGEFPNLKPSTETISIRLPAHLLNGIKMQANKNDVPYQSLMKMMLSEKLDEARGARTLKRISRHKTLS